MRSHAETIAVKVSVHGAVSQTPVIPSIAGRISVNAKSRTIPLSEEAIREELDSGHPLICSMRPGDFTDSGHFIVIYAEEKNGFLIRDPNSPERSARM